MLGIHNEYDNAEKKGSDVIAIKLLIFFQYVFCPPIRVSCQTPTSYRYKNVNDTIYPVKIARRPYSNRT